ELAVGAGGPEAVATSLHFVEHPDDHRVQPLVHARHRLAEHQPTAQGLDRVVGEARHLAARKDDRGVVAVAGDDLDSLAVQHAVAPGERIWTRYALAGQLVHH